MIGDGELTNSALQRRMVKPVSCSKCACEIIHTVITVFHSVVRALIVTTSS